MNEYTIIAEFINLALEGEYKVVTVNDYRPIKDIQLSAWCRLLRRVPKCGWVRTNITVTYNKGRIIISDGYPDMPKRGSIAIQIADPNALEQLKEYFHD